MYEEQEGEDDWKDEDDDCQMIMGDEVDVMTMNEIMDDAMMNGDQVDAKNLL